MIKDNGAQFLQWLVVNTLFQEMMDHVNQKGWIQGNKKMDPCWKSQPAMCVAKTELKLELFCL